MNKVIKLMVLSDLFVLSGFGLIQPIFAIFIINQIPGGSVAAVGLAAAIQLLTRGIFEMPIGKWADEERGNKRELIGLVLGSIVISIVPLGYLFARSLLSLYAIQFFYGLGQAFWYPSWRVIFSRYTDRDRAGYTWSVYDTVTNFGTAASAAVGAFFVEQYSFQTMFIVVAVTSFIGSGFLIRVFQKEFNKK